MGLSSASIDHEGIAAGRLDALEALVSARGDSVIAYALELAGENAAGKVAAEAMARFRGAITALGAGSRQQTDVLLLAATRHAAAAAADLDRIWQGARIQERDRNCELMPTMLAARAVGQLNPADLERVARHLWRCEGCRLVEAAFARAEQAYREPAVDPEPHEVEMMIAALQCAAPVRPSPAPVAQPATRAQATHPPSAPMPAPVAEAPPHFSREEITSHPPAQSAPIEAVFDLDATAHQAHLVERGDAHPDGYVPGRSATFAYGMLAMLAVAIVLAASYLLDGLPG